MTVQEQRAYVFAKWVDVREQIAPHKVTERPSEWMRYVLISGRVEGSGTGDEAIAAAYAFTVAWEEEIRELGEEVEQMADHAHMALERVRDLIDDGDDGEALVIYVRDVCEYTRTWVRLTAILEELKIGWKI